MTAKRKPLMQKRVRVLLEGARRGANELNEKLKKLWTLTDEQLRRRYR